MKGLFACIFLTAMSTASAVLSEDDGNEYLGWCTYMAKSERVAEADSAFYIRDCMASLAAVDRERDDGEERNQSDDNNDS